MLGEMGRRQSALAPGWREHQRRAHIIHMQGVARPKQMEFIVHKGHHNDMAPGENNQT